MHESKRLIHGRGRAQPHHGEPAAPSAPAPPDFNGNPSHAVIAVRPLTRGTRALTRRRGMSRDRGRYVCVPLAMDGCLTAPHTEVMKLLNGAGPYGTKWCATQPPNLGDDCALGAGVTMVASSRCSCEWFLAQFTLRAGHELVMSCGCRWSSRRAANSSATISE